MEYGDKLKQRRLELGLTMQEVADKVGVSKPTIQRYESGNIGNMKRDKIALMAKALKTTPEFIIGIDIEKQPPQIFEFDEADELTQEIFEKYGVLFSKSAKTTPEQLRKMMKIFDVMFNDE